MASPQTGNGHFKIANELWDHICRVRIRAEYRQVFDFIMRKTYGYNKPDDCISTSQIVEGTGLSKGSIHKARAWLLRNKLILITDKGYRGMLKYKINKNYDEWLVYPKKGIVTVPYIGYDSTLKRVQNSTLKRNSTVPYIGTTIITKDNHTKDNVQYTNNIFSSELKSIYTWVDVDAELRKIDGWLLANPKRKKTKRFIINWFNRIDKPLDPEPEEKRGGWE